MTLTKREIARQIHELEPAVSITEAIKIVDTIFGVIKGQLVVGEKVMITNFGTFEVVTRAARRGVNPSTGERLTIPEHRAVTFSPAPALQEAADD